MGRVLQGGGLSCPSAQDLRVIGPYCLSEVMAGKKKQEIEQVEVAKATNSAVYAVVVALGLGAVQQFFVPLKDLAPASAYPFYRFAMLGLLAACVAFVFVRAWLTASDKSHELHHRYAAFRSSIVEDSAEHYYARGIRGALVRVDRFFDGDGSCGAIAQQTIFGMRTPAPLWTVNSYDRCLLIALSYPIAVILILWAWFGHVGPAEASLGLKKADIIGRCYALLVIFAPAFLILSYKHQTRWIYIIGLFLYGASTILFLVVILYLVLEV